MILVKELSKRGTERIVFSTREISSQLVVASLLDRYVEPGCFV